jgi:hypothetical protein
MNCFLKGGPNRLANIRSVELAHQYSSRKSAFVLRVKQIEALTCGRSATTTREGGGGAVGLAVSPSWGESRYLREIYICVAMR